MESRARRTWTLATSIDTLRLVGNRPCLDYVNTIDPRFGPPRRDYVATYPDLVRWAQRVGIVAEDEAQALLRDTAQHPEEALAAFAQAITLREALYRIFSAVAHRAAPETADLERLKTAFVEAMDLAQLTPAAYGFQWDWAESKNKLHRILWPVIRSAVDLLTSEEIKRVKECPGTGDCGWLFLDSSKNNSRHWCSMEGCGSRVKMRRQYARKHGETTGRSTT